eukprot:m.29419 g.29419  ORF g.29419 m.29419 type:complete len:731 (+) comp31167_c0_seq2:50-2242(+)
MFSWSPVFSLGNSILGVSLLAMPYCMKQCGILLGSLLLICSCLLSRLACHLLLKSAQSTRKGSYEHLGTISGWPSPFLGLQTLSFIPTALLTFGSAGKFTVELCLSSLLLFGGCVAYLIIVGDTAPVILKDMFGIQPSWNLRMAATLLLALLVAFPLSLLRDAHNLVGCNTVAFFFYVTFSLLVLLLAVPNLMSGNWVAELNMWKTAGLFQCLPIFSIAFPCQAQLFHLFHSLPEPSVKSMDLVVSYSSNIVACVYLLVGLFGYVAFQNNVSGDVLTSFKDSVFTFALRIGFAASALLSFPLMVFPARASIYSAFLPKTTGEVVSGGSTFIPQSRLIIITGGIVMFTFLVAIFIPNVELILGLTGATAGTIICYIFPGMIFLKTSPDDANLRPWAKLLTVVGCVCLVCSTFAVLSETSKAHDPVEHIPADKAIDLAKADAQKENPIGPAIADVDLGQKHLQEHSKKKDTEPVIRKDTHVESEENVKKAGEIEVEKHQGGVNVKDSPVVSRVPRERALDVPDDVKEDRVVAPAGEEAGVGKDLGERKEPPVPQAPDPEEEEKIKIGKDDKTKKEKEDANLKGVKGGKGDATVGNKSKTSDVKEGLDDGEVPKAVTRGLKLTESKETGQNETATVREKSDKGEIKPKAAIEDTHTADEKEPTKGKESDAQSILHAVKGETGSYKKSRRRVIVEKEETTKAKSVAHHVGSRSFKKKHDLAFLHAGSKSKRKTS